MESIIWHCSHCGNRTPCKNVHQNNAKELWLDGITWFKTEDRPWEKGESLTEYIEYTYFVLQCPICDHLSILRAFINENSQEVVELVQKYPPTDELPVSVPEAVRGTYIEAANIRVRAPHAYVALIRKALELLCQDKGASGKTLLQQLDALSNQGVLPSKLAEMGSLIRQTGNDGVHASGRKISVLDTDLIDEFFRMVVEYVYIAPAKIDELRDHIKHDSGPPDHETPF